MIVSHFKPILDSLYKEKYKTTKWCVAEYYNYDSENSITIVTIETDSRNNNPFGMTLTADTNFNVKRIIYSYGESY